MKTVLENFEIPLQLFFMTQTMQFCMLQMGISCRKLKTISIQNCQDGIRAQMVLKMISRIQIP